MQTKWKLKKDHLCTMVDQENSWRSATYLLTLNGFSSVQSLSRVPTLCDPMNRSTPGLPVHHQLPEIIQTHFHRVSDAILPSAILPLSSCPQIPPSIRVFSNESTLLMRWPEYWSFSFSISPSNEHPGLISYRMDWLDLLEYKGISRVFPTPQFKSINFLALSFLHIHTWPLEKP